MVSLYRLTNQILPLHTNIIQIVKHQWVLIIPKMQKENILIGPTLKINLAQWQLCAQPSHLHRV